MHVRNVIAFFGWAWPELIHEEALFGLTSEYPEDAYSCLDFASLPYLE